MHYLKRAREQTESWSRCARRAITERPMVDGAVWANVHTWTAAAIFDGRIGNSCAWAMGARTDACTQNDVQRPTGNFYNYCVSVAHENQLTESRVDIARARCVATRLPPPTRVRILNYYYYYYYTYFVVLMITNKISKLVRKNIV